MDTLLADGQMQIANKHITTEVMQASGGANKLVEAVSNSPILINTVPDIQKHILNVASFGEFLMGHAQILATIVAVGFSIYTFVLGMKVSRLALKLILKKEAVVYKFGASLILVGILSTFSIFYFDQFPYWLIIILYLGTFVAYILPTYWLVKLSERLLSYSSPDSVISLIKDNLLKEIDNGYKVETSQIKIQEKFLSECEKAGIEVIPGFASLYENEHQLAIKPSKQGYINGFDQNKIERIGQLLRPVFSSEAISEGIPTIAPRDYKTKSVIIYHNIGSYIDPSSINQSLSTVASVESTVENKLKVAALLNNLFEVNQRNKFAIEINDLLVGLKNHILEIISSRNLDEYKSTTIIFPALLQEHYKQCKNFNDSQSLSYLNPIREIIAELLEKTLQIKSPQWIGNTISLFYSMLSLAIENDDIALFQQFVTLFRTIYNLSHQYGLKESQWSSHHLFYKILNHHLIPKLEKELKSTDVVETRKGVTDNAKSFVWSIMVSLSENLKVAYQQGDVAYTTSVIRMLKGSLKYLGENSEVAELIELKDWYKHSLIKLFFNQLGYAFVLADKKSKKNKDIFDLLLSATSEYSVEEMSILISDSNRRGVGYNFPDFMEVFFDEESEYSGSAVFVGDPNTSNFKAYVISVITRNGIGSDKSTPITQYQFDELARAIEQFKNGSYTELIPTLNDTTVTQFNILNVNALNEYKTQTEQSIIDAQLDQTLIDRFKDNVLRGWGANGTLRFLLKSHRKVSKKLLELPTATGVIQLRGFNQRHSKEYFIKQERFGYPNDYGYDYGRAISDGEDLFIYEQCLQATLAKKLNVKDKTAEQIIDSVLSESESSKNTVLFIPFDFWEFQYRNSSNFIPKHTLKTGDKFKELKGFVGYYKYSGVKVPLIYSPERKRKDDKLVKINMGQVGKLTIYKPHGDSLMNKEIYANIVPFSNTELQQIISANPSDLSGLTQENKERKLKQEVGLKALERYSFEITSPEAIDVYSLEEMSQRY